MRMQIVDDSILNGRLMTDDPLDIWKLAEYFPDDMQRPGEVDTVAVDPPKNFSGGLCKTLVDAVVLAAIVTVVKVTEFGLVFFDNLYTIVGAAPVHHDVLKIRVVLHQHRPEGRLNQMTIVEVRRNDADLRPCCFAMWGRIVDRLHPWPYRIVHDKT